MLLFMILLITFFQAFKEIIRAAETLHLRIFPRPVSLGSSGPCSTANEVAASIIHRKLVRQARRPVLPHLTSATLTCSLA